MIKDRTRKIVSDFFSQNRDTADLDVATEKLRIVKAAIDIMTEEMSLFDKCSSKNANYPTVMGQSLEGLLEGNR